MTGPLSQTSRRVRVAAVAAAAAVALLATGALAEPKEVGTSGYRNNTGITQDPRSNANFDGNGYSYSALALQLAGVTPGSKVTAGGHTFTWPTSNSSFSDNIAANGQLFPLKAALGTTQVGLLVSATNGPVAADFVLHYVDAGGAETAPVRVSRVVTDWTRNAGSAAVDAGLVTAVTSQFRMILSAAPDKVNTYVFETNLDVDPTRQLAAVELPVGGKVHIFGIATA